MALDELITELVRFERDPLGYVHFAYPWGEPGELEGEAGPDPWQEDFLGELGEALRVDNVVQIAVATGHGVGKSACMSWLMDWGMATFPDAKGFITANTETQLKTRTWAELAKWHRLSIAAPLFDLGATKFSSRDPTHDMTWRLDMVPWSEHNPSAFQGYHNYGKRLLLLKDEASEIADVIWEVEDGALTDRNTQIIRIAFGNPTSATGRFRQCFPGGKLASMWRTKQIDSRTSNRTNHEYLNNLVEAWGERSDYIRIRVLGQFPEGSNESFIPIALAEEAVSRELEWRNPAPVVLGVDVGRGGDDPSVIYPRQGNDAASRNPEIIYTGDLMHLVHRVSTTFHATNAQAIFVDEGGVGGGVVDRLAELKFPVFGVQFGANPQGTNTASGVKYLNRRAEIWGAMKDWLPTGKIILRAPGMDRTLVEELSGPKYDLRRDQFIVLEEKRAMKVRGVPSPNVADALACTFAFPLYIAPARSARPSPVQYETFDPFTEVTAA